MNVTNIYLSRHEDVKDLAERIGKDIGSLEHLTTEDKKNIVAAINELNNLLATVSSHLLGYVTKGELTQVIMALIDGADIESDTLKKLAEQIAALAQADNGLVNATEPQDFNEAQKQQARDNIGAASKADLANLQLGLTEEQVRAIIEEYHSPKVDQGLAKDYSGTGWYKATDTGVVYNKDIPEGETHIFEGDPIEYISVWRNEGIDADSFTGTEEEVQKLLEWHKNLHRFATSNVTDMSWWVTGYGNSEFYESLGLSSESIVTGTDDISHYDTSNVTDMQNMFAQSSFNQPLDNFNTSNVTNMSSMFEGTTLFNQDISSWDTSNVTDMDGMFSYAASFNQDLSQWCVPLLTGARRFDRYADNWTLPRPEWETCPRGEDSI